MNDALANGDEETDVCVTCLACSCLHSVYKLYLIDPSKCACEVHIFTAIFLEQLHCGTVWGPLSYNHGSANYIPALIFNTLMVCTVTKTHSSHPPLFPCDGHCEMYLTYTRARINGRELLTDYRKVSDENMIPF